MNAHQPIKRRVFGSSAKAEKTRQIFVDLAADPFRNHHWRPRMSKRCVASCVYMAVCHCGYAIDIYDHYFRDIFSGEMNIYMATSNGPPAVTIGWTDNI